MIKKGIKGIKSIKCLKGIILSIGFLIILSCSKESLTQYVDTSIGTGGHGHVFVGANVPFGFVQLGPTSLPESWDWVSGYHQSDSSVIGFSHTHLSGTGIGDLFDVTVMPIVEDAIHNQDSSGNITYNRGNKDDINSGLWSYAERSKEVSVPGYYSVPLTRYNITAEMTATPRVGFHRYTFPKSDKAAIVFDLENGGCWDEATKTDIVSIGNNVIEGYRYSEGWAKDQKIYFVAEFSKPFKKFTTIDMNKRYARVDFNTELDEQILVKVGLSAVDINGARKNLMTELPGWDFELTRGSALSAWEEELSKVRIKSSNKTNKTIFYTALYHTMVAPSVFNDVDGRYRGSNGQNYQGEGFTNYTTFSLWDTYRGAMPLMTIIHPEKVNDMINTMLTIYRQQGKLPVWHLMGNETNCMVGNPGIIPVADAINKGFTGFDIDFAYKAMKNSAMKAERGQELRVKYGYIPCNLFNESVAYDMEYAIADNALAQVAKKLGKKIDYEYFNRRSHSYRNYFDPKYEFIRGLDSNGLFREPFDPLASSHRKDDYCEGNAWQYTWLAPHDLDGLISCFGTKENLLRKLDEFFITKSELGKGASPDISGFIGQYAHGNEPSHHIIYLYTMLGKPWQSAEKVREVLSTLYSDKADGLSGNEDVGQMSAWYILSAFGFYQVNPADGKYYFGSPIFEKATIQVGQEKFKIISHNVSSENKYIQ